MKKTLIACSALFYSFFSCSSPKEVSTSIPYEIKTVYFQKWIGGQELSGSGTNFHLQFKNTLPENIKLTKLYFQGKEGVFIKENETSFIALLPDKTKNDLILDGNSINEYGNKAPEIVNPKFDLQSNQAVIEFQQGNTIKLYKLNAIAEKELLAYPSTRPRK
jgi:hypothetical protein